MESIRNAQLIGEWRVIQLWNGDDSYSQNFRASLIK